MVNYWKIRCDCLHGELLKKKRGGGRWYDFIHTTCIIDKENQHVIVSMRNYRGEKKEKKRSDNLHNGYRNYIRVCNLLADHQQ